MVNITGGVETEGGRTLYGFDAELYLRMKAKEDPELERRVGEWIEDVIFSIPFFILTFSRSLDMKLRTLVISGNLLNLVSS